MAVCCLIVGCVTAVTLSAWCGVSRSVRHSRHRRRCTFSRSRLDYTPLVSSSAPPPSPRPDPPHARPRTPPWHPIAPTCPCATASTSIATASSISSASRPPAPPIPPRPAAPDPHPTVRPRRQVEQTLHTRRQIGAAQRTRLRLALRPHAADALANSRRGRTGAHRVDEGPDTDHALGAASRFLCISCNTALRLLRRLARRRLLARPRRRQRRRRHCRAARVLVPLPVGLLARGVAVPLRACSGRICSWRRACRTPRTSRCGCASSPHTPLALPFAEGVVQCSRLVLVRVVGRTRRSSSAAVASRLRVSAPAPPRPVVTNAIGMPPPPCAVATTHAQSTRACASASRSRPRGCHCHRTHRTRRCTGKNRHPQSRLRCSCTLKGLYSLRHHRHQCLHQKCQRRQTQWTLVAGLHPHRVGKPGS